ncbi:unnamed protein product [Nesidiocoris tenuis]|uniref:Carboxypeptidase n=1 Tax=Nesidiocoris tenuis TaxID=355587 RepID=A0A6H5GXW2_9HEMI|nr:unnamed protein product [Nesidiocoris tenuis]
MLSNRVIPILGCLMLMLNPPNVCSSFINPYPTGRAVCKTNANVGDPLFLTPLIEAGKIDEAKSLSYVPPLLDNIVSYSGYLTVDKNYDSNLFFWFFPAEINPEIAPVVLWLQGGPGAPSLYGTFYENGPFRLKSGSKIERRPHYWSKTLNVIYIDNPVGTGFSFTKSEKGYANNEADVGQNLYSALVQFFRLFPEYRTNDFFVTGESYGGKYVPAAAYTIHKSNPKSGDDHINLKGIAIGDGWVDPLNMIDYADYLFNLSFIDEATKAKFAAIEKKIKSLLVRQKYTEAFWLLDNYIDADLTGYPSLMTNVTGINYYYNFLQGYQSDNNGSDTFMIDYLNREEVRKSIHVGNLTFNDANLKVERHLLVDTVLSIVPWLETLLDSGKYRVLLYNGQLDIICAYPLTMNYVRRLNWFGAEKYKAAQRKMWFVEKGLAGYLKTASNFTEVLVRNAGHMVPADQPRFALDMITRFTNNLPFPHQPKNRGI